MGVCQSAVEKGKSALNSVVGDEQKYNEMCDTAFDKFDTDKSGTIDGAELKPLVNDLVKKIKADAPEIDEEKLKSALNTLDADQDGKVTREEFKKNSRQMLLKICAS